MKILGPYFNAGCLIVQLSTGLFKVWKEFPLQIYQDPIIKEIYNKKAIYRVFIYQVLLSCAILTFLEKNDLQ